MKHYILSIISFFNSIIGYLPVAEEVQEGGTFLCIYNVFQLRVRVRRSLNATQNRFDKGNYKDSLKIINCSSGHP
jgi:hypothetical protein